MNESKSAFTHFSTESRVGRQNQVYDNNGIRQIAGCIAVDPKTNKVLLISSSKRSGVWVLPKGGQEDDEVTKRTAERETYEEAGVIGKIGELVGVFTDLNSSGYPKGNVWFYEFEVQEILSDWPEKLFRERKWCTFEEAIEYLRFKPFARDALQASSFSKTKK